MLNNRSTRIGATGEVIVKGGYIMSDILNVNSRVLMISV